MQNKKGIPSKAPKTLTTGAPANKAAGFMAVQKTLEFMHREPGIIKGMSGLIKMNQKGGFDCSSCAWPDPDDHRSAHEYCENGAKAFASEATSKVIHPDFFKKFSLADLDAQSDHWHELQGRLSMPMIRREGSNHYEPINWNDAFDIIGERLKKLPSADAASFYTSGRASNEAAYSFQLFSRAFGTNNLPDCSNMCHESSGAALVKTIGIGKGTVKLQDFDEADVILVVGQNPGTNHPRMLSALQQAARNGSVIISVNPLQEAGLKGFCHPQEVEGMLNIKTPIAADHYQVKPGGDLSLFKAVIKRLFELDEEEGVTSLDREFIQEFTNGFDTFKEGIKSFDLHVLSEDSGISLEKITRLANVLRGSKKLITCWAMGLTQQDHGVATIQEVTNLHLMLGMIGKPGAGLCPVRGHSNVQGDRTMGVWEKMPPIFHDSLDKHYDFKSPRKHGYDVVETIDHMLKGDVTTFICLGGNFLSASPDTNQTRKALEQCDLTVQISTKLNRSHAVAGKTALILPCLVRSEIDSRENEDPQIITTENSMGVVQSSRGHNKPISKHLLSETQIVCGIAAATLNNKWQKIFKNYTQNYDQIRNDIEKVIPGFDNFNERVRKAGGFYLPNGPRDRKFTTTSGKAEFTTNDLPGKRLEEGQLMLQTLRTHDQYNTTVYGMEDRYRGLYFDRNIIMMNDLDLKERHLKHGEKVNITSHFQGETRELHNFTAVEYNMPSGACAAYFPEANVLVPLHKTAAESNTPTSKAIPVTVEKA